jgi:Formin Homology 2 Domain
VFLLVVTDDVHLFLTHAWFVPETHTVETSCDELSNSVRLRQLLGIVLTFGNRLNTAGAKGKKKRAGAFTLDSLLKLNQAKAFDKKTTFLQYIVLIVQRNNELLLRFKDDLPTVFKADKVFWDQCVSDLEEVENQLENVRRIALYQARQASKFRRKKKKHHGEGEDESISDMSLSLEEEVEALRATPIGLFTLSAIKKVSFLRDRVEGTKVKFTKLLEYFGEDEKHWQPHELFNIIVKFCGDFEKAKEQVIETEKKKKREERKRHTLSTNVQTQGNARPVNMPLASPHAMLRASSLQPNAGQLINDMKRSGALTFMPAPTTAKEKEPIPQEQISTRHPQSTAEARSNDASVQPYKHSHRQDPPQDNHSRPQRESMENPPNDHHPVEHVGQAIAPGHSHQLYRAAESQSQQTSAEYLSQSYPTYDYLHSTPQRESAPAVQLDDLIPRGMQDRGQMELAYEHPPLLEQEVEPNDTSVLSEQSSSALRMRARQQRQRKATSPEDSTPSREPTHLRSAASLMRQSSAPIVASNPMSDRVENRRSSTNEAAASNSLARNKARAKRLMEKRKEQRAMANF